MSVTSSVTNCLSQKGIEYRLCRRPDDLSQAGHRPEWPLRLTAEMSELLAKADFET